MRSTKKIVLSGLLVLFSIALILQASKVNGQKIDLGAALGAAVTFLWIDINRLNKNRKLIYILGISAVIFYYLYSIWTFVLSPMTSNS